MNNVKYIDELLKDEDTTEEVKQNDYPTDIIESKFKKVSNSDNLKIVEEIEEEKISELFLDLNEYQIEKSIFKSDTKKICKIRNLITNDECAAYISMLTINQIAKEQIEKLSHDLGIISQLSHPSILKFHGFSLTDFKNHRKPVIKGEIASNGVLEQILELEKMNKKINGWDETKKIINIYGIASAMAYLHSNNIIHCCLNPTNIYLDDILCPKIGDFGLLTRFTNTSDITLQSISGAKGTPIYSAPEVLEFNMYSKSSDVYSFSLVVYEILTNEKPFSDISNTSQIYHKIIKGERPIIKNTIPDRFKKLIEQCWSQNPNDRPDFDNIVYLLKKDQSFIIKEINKEDYEKYINFIDSKIAIKTSQKIKESVEVSENNLI